MWGLQYPWEVLRLHNRSQAHGLVATPRRAGPPKSLAARRAPQRRSAKPPQRSIRERRQQVLATRGSSRPQDQHQPLRTGQQKAKYRPQQEPARPRAIQPHPSSLPPFICGPSAVTAEGSNLVAHRVTQPCTSTTHRLARQRTSPPHHDLPAGHTTGLSHHHNPRSAPTTMRTNVN